MKHTVLDSPPDTPQRQKKCESCGKSFLASSKWHYSMVRERFCSAKCKKDHCVKSIEQLKSRDIPVMELTEEGIRCNLCDRVLKVVGTHITRTHGLDVGHKMSILERLFMYGLPMGYRLATPEMRQFWREHCMRLHQRGILSDGIPEGQSGEGIMTERARKYYPHVRKSQAQIDSFVENAMLEGNYSVHVNAWETVKCSGCGEDFQKRKGQKSRRYCTIECYVKSRAVELKCQSCGVDFLVRKSESERLKKCPSCRKKVAK